MKGTLAVETGGKHFEKLSITNSVFRDIRLVLCSDSPSPQPFTAGVLYPKNADPDGAARSRCAESTSLHTHAHQVRDRQNPLKPRSLTMSNLPRTPRWRRLRLPKSTAANRPPRPPFDIPNMSGYTLSSCTCWQRFFLCPNHCLGINY